MSQPELEGCSAKSFEGEAASFLPNKINFSITKCFVFSFARGGWKSEAAVHRLGGARPLVATLKSVSKVANASPCFPGRYRTEGRLTLAWDDRKLLRHNIVSGSMSEEGDALNFFVVHSQQLLSNVSLVPLLSQEIGGISLSVTFPGMHSWRPSILVDFLRRRVYLMRGTNVVCEIRAIFHFRALLNKCAGSSREEEGEREKEKKGEQERDVTLRSAFLGSRRDEWRSICWGMFFSPSNSRGVTYRHFVANETTALNDPNAKINGPMVDRFAENKNLINNSYQEPESVRKSRPESIGDASVNEFDRDSCSVLTRSSNSKWKAGNGMEGEGYRENNELFFTSPLTNETRRETGSTAGLPKWLVREIKSRYQGLSGDGTSQGEIHHPRASLQSLLVELRGQWRYAAEPLLETRYMHGATSAAVTKALAPDGWPCYTSIRGGAREEPRATTVVAVVVRLQANVIMRRRLT
ncbi:hypothetical protein DBV15_07718 [Temnothorax longispinosus]|uniref:Uncharacterized protein n=1 Tax=Temnothorax longispinosus TaxID=300112 RepID=A0A4S2KQI3_9HYME|nr:hypothetical protein DBV15_07718 [Temnothorax longispinosus]